MNDGILTFQFNAINLPDSASNPAGSEGYVCYRIRPLSSLSVGEVIENTAAVYFDFNLPVITNTTQTEVVDIPTAIHRINKPKDGLSIYPNPSSDAIVIECSNHRNGTFSIYNSLGEKVKEFSGGAEKIILPLTGFSKGLYHIVYTGDTDFFNTIIIQE